MSHKPVVIAAVGGQNGIEVTWTLPAPDPQWVALVVSVKVDGRYLFNQEVDVQATTAVVSCDPPKAASIIKVFVTPQLPGRLDNAHASDEVIVII